jgi:uncharacterized protein (UPF0212 family)
MSGMKISPTSVVFAAAIIVASCVSFAEGAEIAVPRGRARLNDAHTTFDAFDAGRKAADKKRCILPRGVRRVFKI